MAKPEARTRHLVPWDPDESSPESPRIRRQVAVVAGVGRSLSDAFLQLPNARGDADAVARLLAGEYGFELVADLGDSPGGEAIRGALRSSLKEADTETRWLFYFAGHGHLRDEVGYLLPGDATLEASSTWLALPELIAACLDSAAGEALIILDACYGGQALVRPDELQDLLPADQQARMRVRQILCAGGPDQEILDGGGGKHSVFTACLLEALRGWAGVHEPDGTVQFRSLLNYLQTEVDSRLKALAVPPFQRPFGGNLIGTLKRGGFELVSRVPRVPPETVKWLSSKRPSLRCQGLEQLVEDTRRVPELLPTARDLAWRHLPAPYRRNADSDSAPPPLDIQPDELERRQAAGALAGLAGIAQANFRRVAASLQVDREIGALLRRLALEDPSDYVRDHCRKGLRQVSPETQKELGAELLEIQSRGDRRLRRQAWEILASIPVAVESLLSPRLRVRAHLTRARLWSGGMWRTATSTRARRWMLATPALAVVLLYAGLASRYYLSIWGSAVVVRAGHPGFEALPLIGRPVVVTDYSFAQLDDPNLALDERLGGSWLHLSDGAFAWDKLLARHLDSSLAALSLWRAGHRGPALAQLAAAVETRDPTAIEIAAYVGFQSDEALPTVIDMLVAALAQVDGDARRSRRPGETDPHDAVLAALGVLRDVRPVAVGRHVETLIDRLESASGLDEVALVEALEVLSRNDPGWRVSVRRPVAKKLAARLRIATAKELVGTARAIRSLVYLDPALLADLLPDVCDALRRGQGDERLLLLNTLAAPVPLSEPDLDRAVHAAAQVLAEADEAAQQSAAIHTLSALARRSPRPLATLVTVLSKAAVDAAPEVRLDAAEALSALTPQHVLPRRVAELLVELIDRDVPTSVHTAAVRLLGGIRDRPSQAVVVPALLDAAADWSSLVRQEAVHQLIEIGLDIALDTESFEPVLRAALDDQSPEVQREAAQGFLLLADQLPGDVDPAIDLLVRALESDDWLEARGAAALAQRFARASPAALRRLTARLEARLRQAEDFFAARAILEFLKEVGRCQPATLPALALLAADLLEGDGDSLSSDAIDLLWSLHELPVVNREGALDALFARLAAGTAGQRAAAAVAIGYLAPGDERLFGTALARLSPLLAESDPKVRVAGGRALAVLGEAQGSPRPLVEALLGGLAQDEPEVRRICAKALARIRTTDELAEMAMAALIERLSDTETEVRQQAALALRHWGHGRPRAASSILEPLARRLASEPVAEVRFEIAAAMGALGGDDPRIVDRVIGVAEETLAAASEERLQVRVARLLGPMGERHPSTAQRIAGVLEPLLESPEYSPRQSALLTLRDIGMSDPRSGALVLKVLEPLMLDPDWPGRWDGIANAIQPIVRTYPQYSERATLLLRRFLRQGFRDRREEHLAETAADALIETVALAAARRPVSVWPWLTAAGSFERRVGREVLARLADEDPERVPALRARLATYRRDLRPEVRQSAAQAEEMIAILEHNRQVMSAASGLERWREVLDWLPRQAAVRSAVNLALDRLEPGTRHL